MRWQATKCSAMNPRLAHDSWSHARTKVLKGFLVGANNGEKREKKQWLPDAIPGTGEVAVRFVVDY